MATVMSEEAPRLTGTGGGRILPKVADTFPLSARPYDHLVRAVETHAAIREGTPHQGTTAPAQPARPLTSGKAGSGSRRAPQTRKKAK